MHYLDPAWVLHVSAKPVSQANYAVVMALLHCWTCTTRLVHVLYIHVLYIIQNRVTILPFAIL